MQIAFPFRIDGLGQIAGADSAEHVQELIEQVLFTSPGDRVNRPSFGSGLLQLTFAPASDDVATAIQFLVQGALQQWLGDLIQVEAVDVQAEEARLNVTVRYILRRTQQRQIAQFSRGT